MSRYSLVGRVGVDKVHSSLLYLLLPHQCTTHTNIPTYVHNVHTHIPMHVHVTHTAAAVIFSGGCEGN